ncbi:MAG: hypothetical protein K2O57_01105, partial [Acetatifactor sp.]|nr:hypothetical protein [Acetatifactor sp.]
IVYSQPGGAVFIGTVAGEDGFIVIDSKIFREGQRIVHIQRVGGHLFHEQIMGQVGELFFIFFVPEEKQDEGGEKQQYGGTE